MKTKFNLWSYILMFTLSCVVSEIVIPTRSGPIRGKLNNYNGIEYHSFHAIPYAENPSGVLRFKPPVPKKPWTSVLDATQEGVVCPQWDLLYRNEQMSEDCLNLNVYVPKYYNKQLPVLVFIHGGGYFLLSGNSDYIYGPQFFLQRDIIFVTMNFRIGPLGFLSLGTNEASGNAGLKDIILALKWVKENISQFGGNSNSITLGGHSSGAALAHCLMMTDQTNGLFHRVILISGSALSRKYFSQTPTHTTLSLAQKLGIKSNDTQVILKALQEANVFDIYEEYKTLNRIDKSIFRSCCLFGPCVEGNFSHAVLTEIPKKTIEKGLMRKIPVIAGINAQEAIYMLPFLRDKAIDISQLRNNIVSSIPTHFEYPLGSREEKILANKIAQKYFPNYKISKNVSVDEFIELSSDIRYNYDIHSWIKLYKENPFSNALYFYIFDFDGDLNLAKIRYKIDHPGTAHADEMGYMFVTNCTKNLIQNASNESKDMIKLVVTLFSNFIKFGTPADNGIKWPKFDLKNRMHLVITTNPTVRVLPNSINNFDFWYNLHTEYQNYMDNGGIIHTKCRLY